MIRGVMFDFSGTLLRIESMEEWLDAGLAATGIRLSDEEFRETAGRLTEYGALPGGSAPRRIPPHLAALWQERDVSTDQHRAAYGGLALAAGLPAPELAQALYDRHMSPAAWRPYPDTVPTLRELRRRGVPVAVVSNIGWDLRPVFRTHGLDELVDVYVLSYELGVQKPDPLMFRTSCDLLGLPPGEVLMVGDDRTADGGAAALGCPVHFVDHLPVDRRPHGLTPLLDRLG
ncbi:HAD-IA family hydrolase [Streptomyces yangpuensis]|uniref:HAD-IA family hydrolase n=1 Tax=Streptomyces yangpuensis TaxID=1648182 RepID=A0ABY5PQC4_9ACTN|nr:HAD-IA family hydrolase [Streptomyces yangpuensis]UUY46201.1 HAD-IA family hydrolase [Streptomyces yangpuensis]